MNLRLSFACVLMAFSVCANSQTKPADFRNFSNDIGPYAGVYFTTMYEGHEAELTYGFNYGHFNYNGLGYRAGVQIMSRVAEVDNAIGFPVAFAYRTKAISTEGRVKRGAVAAGETFGYDVIMGYRDPLRGALAAFIANLFSQAEFFAGITPGYISGESSTVSTAYWGPSFENQKSSWTELNGHFLMTLDAGACANYRIWRFDLKLSPAVHYNLTNNYLYRTEQSETVTTKPLRWFFSFTGGLSYRF
ncbi:MAG: hypothetical protein IJ205_02045 [Bacteroidales bacterium]|nr:hypothetical protein [Bacteroidales bacterium]